MQPTEEEYDMIQQIGAGVGGDVIKAREKKSGNLVALKRVKYQQREVGLPPGTVKEISFLKNHSHPNISRFRSISRSRDGSVLYIVLDYYPYDLHGLIYSQNSCNVFDHRRIRCFMHQILSGINAIHKQGFIHCDLKPPNMLIKNDNTLVLADFGLITEDNNKPHPCAVITLWYRPPELLLGATQYGKEVDIWSVGCIFYEIAAQRVLFQSEILDDTKQLETICSALGVYVHKAWEELPLVCRLPKATTSSTTFESFLSQHISSELDGAVDLLMKLLAVDPKSRITAEEALNHPFFKNHPDDLAPSSLPLLDIPEVHQNISVKLKTSSCAKCCRPRRNR